MEDSVLFAGCIIVLVTLLAVLARYRTALFGLTLLNIFMVGSATLSAFFFATLLNEDPISFTPEHRDVVLYSIIGLLAMIAGVFMGWRPLARGAFGGGRLYVTPPIHINDEVGWVTYWVGVAAIFGIRLVNEIPTISTAVNCLAHLERIGLFILLVNAISTGKWRRFLLAAGFFVFSSIWGALGSGHTFLRMNALVPIVAILFASSGFSLKLAIPAVLSFFLMTPLVMAWMQTRYLIRENRLDGTMLDQAMAFFKEYFSQIEVPSSTTFVDFLIQRVDQTAFLAAQVRHQPLFEPYAYGETIYSAFYTLIPRFVWQAKPNVAGGSEFVARYTGVLQNVDDITSIGVPYPFELFANGGPIMVVIGLAVIGFASARLELLLLRKPKSLGGFWALALGTAVLCEGGQRTDVVLPALVASVITAYVIGYLLERFWFHRDILSEPEPLDRPMRSLRGA